MYMRSARKYMSIFFKLLSLQLAAFKSHFSGESQLRVFLIPGFFHCEFQHCVHWKLKGGM